MIETSLAARLAARGPDAWAEVTAGMTAAELEAFEHEWRFWARPAQLVPWDELDWTFLVWQTGRGWGKTRSEVEAAREAKERHGRLVAVSRTAFDIRETLIEGESGFLATAPSYDRPEYEPSKRRLTWKNGARMTLLGADEPDTLRGPQFEFAIVDELAAWRYLDEAWANLMFGLRLGPHPRAVIGTTPKPRKKLREIIYVDASAPPALRVVKPNVRLVRGSLYENIKNLAPTFRDEILATYEGTRLGEQEIYGREIDDVPGALWQRAWIDETRIEPAKWKREHAARVVVAIDPAATSTEGANATGIVAAARLVSPCPFDGADKRPHYAVLRDASAKATPLGWAKRAVDVYDELDADRIIGEVNNGGEMVAAMVKQVDRTAHFRAVHASRGKAIRAEPISGLYEQRRVHHVGTFPLLEDQLVTFTPEQADRTSSSGEHWDRLDADVWALSELSARGPLLST